METRTEPLYDARMADALTFVAERFARQTRKGNGTPYLGHLLAVAALVMEHGGTTEQTLAAILHDYLEDIPGASFDEVSARFGRRVAELVRALSDAEDAEHKAPWRERKVTYLAKLADEPAEVKLVAAADKLHNATTLLRDVRRHGRATFERFRGKEEGTRWYHREVVVALRRGFSHPILDELEAVVLDIERLCA
jgi:(p)ppGpp synthase/HD superfamily hydrolase